MTPQQQKKAAKHFAESWQGKGYEKGETQRFWLDLLHNVFGEDDPTKTTQFEIPVKTITKEKGADFIDGYIIPTKVLIEQKGAHVDLAAKAKQSDGSELTPYQQARRYAEGLPLSQKPRWIVTCNFREFWVYDMERPNGEPQKIALENLENEYYRLQFLVDLKNENIRREEEVSLKAGELVGKLYDALIKEYIEPDESSLRSLNILCVRIVFCLYAEDAGLFATRTSFEDYIRSFNLPDLRDGIIKLFKALDTQMEQRDKYDLKIKAFPYVNGGLFADQGIEIPNFTEEIVDVLVHHCCPFDWSEISPTIFGAVFESTLNPETRRKGGMHYTSVANIHKVIDPLFMDDLNAEFESLIGARMSPSAKRQSLLAFQQKLGSLTFLDPACGSGNFLTETYLSLRRLENKVISALNKGEKVLGFNDEFIKVSINQFYGIEINDFAVTVAKTALWIAESQMVAETEAILGMNLDFLPLKDHANIVEGNALRMDWSTLAEDTRSSYLYAKKLNVFEVENLPDEILNAPIMACESAAEYGKVYDELNVVAMEVEKKTLPSRPIPKPVVYDYIIGNPPFVGASMMSDLQKQDAVSIFGKVKLSNSIDYVGAWYHKAAELMSKNPKTHTAFVSTNSISQGEQVAALWSPLIKRYNVGIDFAYRTFRWDSESEQKAHVHCVIIGFSVNDSVFKKATPCRLYLADGQTIDAKNINPYLIDAPNVLVESRPRPICKVECMIYGNKPTDGGNFILSEEEKDAILRKEPSLQKYIHPYIGAVEFINNKVRYCLWLQGISPAELRNSPILYERVQNVKRLREASSSAATRQKAAVPHEFFFMSQPTTPYLIIPRVSSESRLYVPIGFMSPETIASDACSIIPNATLFHFGILTSRVHMAWMRVVAGRLKSDYRYSGSVVYNNFPWPLKDAKIPSSQNNTKEAKIPSSQNDTKETKIPSSQNDTKETKGEVGNFTSLIEKTAQAILDARALYPDSSLADLYDETTMPIELRRAHRENDKAVMAAYGFKPDMAESEIVAELFRMYDKIIKSNV